MLLLSGTVSAPEQCQHFRFVTASVTDQKLDRYSVPINLSSFNCLLQWNSKGTLYYEASPQPFSLLNTWRLLKTWLTYACLSLSFDCIQTSSLKRDSIQKKGFHMVTLSACLTRNLSLFLQHAFWFPSRYPPYGSSMKIYIHDRFSVNIMLLRTHITYLKQKFIITGSS